VTGSREGFTLIEVVGALIIFSVGVLMVIRLTGTLSVQMERAALRSEVSVAGQVKLDSLDVLPFDSLTPGSTADTLAFRGRTYVCTITVQDVTAVLRQVDVALIAADSLGPGFAGTVYAARAW